MQKKPTNHSIQVQFDTGLTIALLPIQPQDYWGVCDLIVANENRLQRYFPETSAANVTPELSKRFAQIKSIAFDKKEEFLFVIKHTNPRKIIGLIYIKALDWVIKQGELAYCIDYNFEGQGITSALVSSLGAHAFESLGLEVLQIHVHKDNIASVKVAEKCNFTWVKTLSKSYTPPGKEAFDMELYELYKN